MMGRVPATHTLINDKGERVAVILPQRIPDDSWLHDEDFALFRAAYAYAVNVRAAVPALSQVHPEDLYYAYVALKRGEVEASQSE